MQFFRVKYLYILIIIFGFVILSAFFYSFVNQSYILVVKVKPEEQFNIKIGNKDYKIKGTGLYEFSSGNKKIEFSKAGYDTLKTTVNIQRNNNNILEVNMLENIAGDKNIYKIKGLADSFKEKYIVDSIIKYNDNLATVVIIKEAGDSERLVMLVEKVNGDWVQKIPPVEFFTDSQIEKYPKDIRPYLKLFNNKEVEEGGVI